MRSQVDFRWFQILLSGFQVVLRGHQTVLGGSILSANAMKAIEESNKYFVEMTELVEKTGDAIAKLLGCEAVHVTPGAAAAAAATIFKNLGK